MKVTEKNLYELQASAKKAHLNADIYIDDNGNPPAGIPGEPIAWSRNRHGEISYLVIWTENPEWEGFQEATKRQTK